ncbi:MAG: response regulator [Geminicoccaceae bacterium]
MTQISHLLRRMSPAGLFATFITCSFLACILFGAGTIAYRTQQTTIEQQRRASQHQLDFASSFVELFLQQTIDGLNRVVRSPIVINNVMGGTSGLDNLADFAAHRGKGDLTFFDLALDVVYTEKPVGRARLHADDLAKQFNRVLDGDVDSYVFLKTSDGLVEIGVVVPIVYRGSIEGVLLANFPAASDELFPAFVNLDNTFELVDGGAAFSASNAAAERQWLWLEKPLRHPNLTLRLGLAKEILVEQQRTTVFSALYTILMAFLISFVVVYWLGRKMLLNPYRELDRSRRALTANAERLKASEQEARQLALVAENANDVVVITDGDGVALWVNRAFTELTGYSKDEILGRKPGRLLQGPESDRDAVQDIRQALAAGKRIRTEIVNYTKAGQAFWIDIDIAPVFDDHGQIMNFISIERDITERKKLAQDRKIALAEAKQATKAKAQFLAMMSHEIRTPMNGVLGTIGLLDDMPMPEDQRVLVKTARESAEFLLTILNDILDFSKLEAGKMQLEEVPFDIADLLKGALELCAGQAQSKGLSLSIDLAPDVPRCIAGDPGRIRQMILNYLSNAVKFTDRGSVVIEVTARPESQGKVGLCFAVRDTGIGIPADKADRLFSDFNQVDSSIARRFGGTGLGLAITKLLAENMGGRVWFESTPGVGTTFYFAAPFEAADDSARHHASVQTGQDTCLRRQDLRVLLAEDNRTNQMIAQAMLRRMGCSVDVAANGLEAVDAAAARPYDIILMDVQMPEMDGLEATRKIRCSPGPQSTLPIIALTANAMAGDKEECLETGMNDFVSKPIAQPDLIAVINAVLADASSANAAA